MFGVLKGTSCSMETADRREWMGHICGVCLALRDNAGHASRVTTNYDAALISALCEAQTTAPPERYTSHCPLRSQFKAQVTAPKSAAAQYAASVALVMAATKIEDHVADGETSLRHVPTLSKAVAKRWAEKGQDVARKLGFETAQLHQQTSRQSDIEAQRNRDFYFYAQPTELAVGAAFQHTAVIANQPLNGPILYELGRMFGRIMYLLDSYEDYASDVAAQKFNALAACFAPDDIKGAVKRLFNEAFRSLKQAFGQLTLPRPELVQKLLLTQLKQRSFKVLELAHCGTACSCRLPAEPALAEAGAGASSAGAFAGVTDFLRRRKRKKRPRSESRFGCCETIICLDCCTECCCCCDFDICDCEAGGCEFCECEVCECCECSVCGCGEGCCCDCDCG